MAKFNTKFRLGDLVREKKTGGEGVIVDAQTMWNHKDGLMFCHHCEGKPRGATDNLGGHYEIQPKNKSTCLSKWAWYGDDEIELSKKGVLH